MQEQHWNSLLPSRQIWCDRRAVFCIILRPKRQQSGPLTSVQVAPSSHQAAELKAAIDDAIVKEGLIGVGVGTGLITVAAVAIGLLMSSRKR